MRSLLIVCCYRYVTALKREAYRNDLNVLQSKHSLLKLIVTLSFAEIELPGEHQLHLRICYVEQVVEKQMFYLCILFIYFIFIHFSTAMNAKIVY
jgi:hypothetical protein